MTVSKRGESTRRTVTLFFRMASVAFDCVLKGGIVPGKEFVAAAGAFGAGGGGLVDAAGALGAGGGGFVDAAGALVVVGVSLAGAGVETTRGTKLAANAL